MFRSILVAIDGSPAAAAALTHAIDLAHDEGARLTLITVVPAHRWLLPGPYIAPVPTEEELERQAQQIVDEAERLVPDEVPVSTVVRRGPVLDAILGRVECAEHDASLSARAAGAPPARSCSAASASRSRDEALSRCSSSEPAPLPRLARSRPQPSQSPAARRPRLL